MSHQAMDAVLQRVIAQRPHQLGLPLRLAPIVAQVQTMGCALGLFRPHLLQWWVFEKQLPLLVPEHGTDTLACSQMV